MNILVIGGNGFIGSHLIDHLLLKGHNVRVFDVSYERYRKPLPNVDYRISALENIPDLYEALLGIDIIFHLASASVPSTSNVDTVSDINKNLIPTLNILNLSVKLGIKRIIYFSSGGAVYGNPLTKLISENHPLNPISSYGIVKVTIEMYLSLYQRMYGLNPLILRPSNPYGPRQGHFIAQGVISTFLRKVQKNEELTVYGDGNSAKDYIYIKDMIDLSYQLSISDEVGIFNLGSGIGTSINQIIDQIKKTTKSKLNINFVEKQIYDVDHFVLDISKTTNLLGNYPITTLKEGIENTRYWLNSIV
ncbi:MAG: NAD-dependent epimerase/dehydratase family protein [Paludibacter sp.]|nr:NAD-dependent epimerase/dehydratase family protein [Paludibacter sp.]